MENNSEKVDLIPDENGFLFEIEDKGFIIFKLFITLILFIIYFLAFALKEFNLMNIMESSRLGVGAVIIGLPYIIYQIFYIIHYAFRNHEKKNKIKFYKTYISTVDSKFKIDLEKVKKIYILEKYNVSGKTKGHSKLLVFFLFPWFIYMYICSFLSIYVFTKGFVINNILFIMENGERIGSITYALLNKKDKRKVDFYFRKYLDVNVDEIEKKTILLPSE